MYITIQRYTGNTVAHTVMLSPTKQHAGEIDVRATVGSLREAIERLENGDGEGALRASGEAFASIGEHLREGDGSASLSPSSDSLVGHAARLSHRGHNIVGTITKQTEPDADGARYVEFTVGKHSGNRPFDYPVEGETFWVDRDDNDGALEILS